MAPHEQLNTEAVPAGADVEKGGSAARVSPCPHYQATYVVGSTLPDADRRSRRRSRARFLHAFALTVLFIFFLPVLIRNIMRVTPFLLNHLRGRPSDMRSQASCTQEAHWTFDPDNRIPHNQFAHVAEASFDLPVSSDALFFWSRGATALAHGSIEFTDSGEAGSDNIRVEVAAFYNDVDEFLELTKVCMLQPDEGKNGIGIFAPHHWSGPHSRQIQFKLKVRLPASLNGSPLSINKLDTDLPLFLHHVGPLSNIVFNYVSFKTSNMPVHVESLVSGITTITTSNSPIEGQFNTSTFLDLRTSNSPIKANIGLFNDGSGSSTGLRMRSSNGPIGTNISLFSTAEHGVGGSFNVDIHTSNSPMSIAFPSAPVDNTLHVQAHTSNSPAHVALHRTFEGAFKLAASRFFRPTVRADPLVEDPAGRGRQRSVEYRTIGAVVEGLVRWLPLERKTAIGEVVVSTSNMGLDLSL